MYSVIEANTTDLLCALMKAPVSVCIDAEDGFQNYDSGIYWGGDCATDMDSLNHGTLYDFNIKVLLGKLGVLLVGFGSEDSDNGASYIVKNSWGQDWGEGNLIECSLS